MTPKQQELLEHISQRMAELLKPRLGAAKVSPQLIKDVAEGWRDNLQTWVDRPACIAIHTRSDGDRIDMTATISDIRPSQ